MKTKIGVILMMALLLLAGCTSRQESLSEEEFPSRSKSSNIEIHSNAPEESNLDTPSDIRDLSSSTPDLPFSESDKTSPFSKIEVGVTADGEYGVFALDSDGQLYFGSDNSAIDIVDSQVKDFSSTESTLYILKENGDLLSTGTSSYQKDAELTCIYQDTQAQMISDSVIVLSDQSVIHFSPELESWNPVDISAQKVDADYFGAAIIDTDGTLWYLDRQTEKLQKIAENVIDCSYTDRNKVYYSDDLWYITQDYNVHLYSARDSMAESIAELPTNAVSIDTYMGHYFVKNTDGAYRFGSLSLSSEFSEIEIQGRDADIFGTYYAMLGQNGVIHFGKIQSDQTLAECKIISHP